MDKTEEEKMLAGELYAPADPAFQAAHREARRRCRVYNAATEDEREEPQRLLRELLGRVGRVVELKPPFHGDYGKHIHLGDGVFINFGCVMLDCNRATIGERAIFGPGVQIYAAGNPCRVVRTLAPWEDVNA